MFKRAVNEAGLRARIHSDSAGTHAYQMGDQQDARAQRQAAKRGYDLSALRARKIAVADYERFDYLLAMDENNLSLLMRDCPKGHTKLSLFMRHGARGEPIAVPDPYYGGAQGFKRGLDMAGDAAQGLLRHIRIQHRL